ncbi:glycoside hydrolase family 32 protein [Pontibacter sp. 172403-2]|uniref:glycoside hydrolase family 32 protein n=1 Tax=Pontibacter rufus TaxID=2791028 RepID=UPI0018AFAFAC|nr:glycoside hydrolase family 32 protein [Pontibacter sp. 172403-2]MBF9251952.1 glycoside hydrolase family 32 protein [Pontibacter sp. 172403-2]
MKKIYAIAALGLLLYSCSSNQNTGENTDTADAVTATASSFDEPHRPQFHFTPPSGWMNDPNGMVYYKGEYHLFYQHNPDSTVWGPMHWGHAVSNDMVHWKHLPIALYPDSLGMIFSGSAVVDISNTSGLGTKVNPAMVAIFTYHNAEQERVGKNDFQTQGIAFSLDNGRSWTKYKNNPVLKNPGIRDFRDPKVSWYEAGQKWIMTLAVKDHISFYSSKNLLDWKLESDFGADVGAHGGVWECPDLFKLKVNGTNEEKWVLLVNINPGAPNGGSGTQYFIGSFDGNRFVMDPRFEAGLNAKPAIATAVNGQEGIWLDYGRDEYAGVTWANVPDSDGRRLFMGWMSNWNYANVVPTEKWRSAMTVARTLELENTPAGLRVVSQPVQELQNIYGDSYTFKEQAVSDTLTLSGNVPFTSSTFDLQLDLERLSPDGQFAVELSNNQNQKVLIGYDAARGQYYIDRRKASSNSFSDNFAGIHYAPRLATDDSFPVRLLVDVASVEFFADGGKTVMTDIFFPDEVFTKIRLIADKGQLRLTSGIIHDLKSIYASAEQK